MKKKLLSIFVLLLLCGLFQVTGAQDVYADAIPENACTDAEHSSYEDVYGCGVGNHSFIRSGSIQACNTAHYDYYVCYNCSSSYYIYSPAANHKWVLISEGKAKCTSDGYKYYECSVCDELKYETVPCTGHKTKRAYDKASATNHKDGSVYDLCSVCDSQLNREYFAYPSTLKLSYEKTAYSGTAKKPTVKVYDHDGNRIYSSQYQVSYSNNVKTGKATVTVKFTGKKYSGTLKTNFIIVPKKVTNVSVSYQATAKMKVKWSKATGASGYALYYSTSSSFPEDGRTCIKFYSSSRNYAIIPYMAKKTYYVKVVAYKTINGTRYPGAYSDKKKITISTGASMMSMLSHLKSTTANRSTILELTNNQVDIKKYSSTISRIKAIYTWHAKNSNKFVHCLACNHNFNMCIYYLIDDKTYDEWIHMGCDRYKNNSGSVVQHKWSVLYLQGTPFIFDPRMQGNIGNPGGFTYFGITYGSSTGKHYLLDEYLY